jgi:hypothetical protein
MTGGGVTLAAPHRGGADGVTNNCEPAHTSRYRWGAWLARGCHHWKRGHYDAPSYRTGIIDWHRLERRHPGKCHHQLPEIRGLSGLPSELVALRRLSDHELPVAVITLRAFSSAAPLFADRAASLAHSNSVTHARWHDIKVVMTGRTRPSRPRMCSPRATRRRESLSARACFLRSRSPWPRRARDCRDRSRPRCACGCSPTTPGCRWSTARSSRGCDRACRRDRGRGRRAGFPARPA